MTRVAFFRLRSNGHRLNQGIIKVLGKNMSQSVIVDEAAWPVWLGEAPGDHTALLRPAPDDLLQLWPVSRAVNNTQNNEAALLAPLADRRAIPVG